MWRTYALLPDLSELSQPYTPLAVVWDDCQEQLECEILEVIHQLVGDVLRYEHLAWAYPWLNVCFGSFSILGSWGPGYKRHKACLFTNYAILDGPLQAEDSSTIGGWPVADDDLECFEQSQWAFITEIGPEKRERLVRATLKAAWAKFGIPDLDDAITEYLVSSAVTVVAEAQSAGEAEDELLLHLGVILKSQELKDKYVVALCRALAGTVSATPKEVDEGDVPKEGEGPLLCRCRDLILMYMGSTDFLLKDTTFELRKGHRYGIVGSNGTGKTTLMERIADGAIAELSYTSLRFVHIHHESLSECVDKSLTAAAYAREVVGPDIPIHSALAEVGFTNALKSKPVCELSGGWRVRLLLATAVARQADVLLLDEPTNHLDSQAVAWLVNYITCDLAGSTSVVVSHDAAFLDQICTDIIHFDESQLKYYKGNFNEFRKQVQLRDAQELLQVRSRGAREQPSTTVPEATKAEGKIPKSGETSGTPVRVGLPVPGKVEGLTSSRKPVIELKDVSFRYLMASEYILQHVYGKVTAMSRIAIVGPNGSGKSTLVSLLCGEIRPCADEQGAVGEVERHRSLRLAYVAQGHSFHLGEYARCTPEEYIQVRYRNGYDEELQRRLLAPPEEKEAALLKRLGAKFGKYGKQVEAVISRCKRRNDWRYEVKWEDLAERQNTFESAAKLRQLGVERLATALDERLAVGTTEAVTLGSCLGYFEYLAWLPRPGQRAGTCPGSHIGTAGDEPL
ncbi:NEW1 [Symbiodinium natans]|uniref:NEW1 protein n=1 Tax=Symbiodinium natans TaxID=878477 RepID=A0A812I963_9DINO|nr:NEW1 [Symbiodinium natans]